MRLQNISKTGEDSRGLEGTPGDSKGPRNLNVFTSQKPKSFAIIGLGFMGEKGSIPAASTKKNLYNVVVTATLPYRLTLADSID